MPSIIAICPYCRAGGVRAEATAIGASATCPKCKSSFTILPSDEIPPDWDKPAARPVPSFAAPAGPPLDETDATAAMADVTEPSPVLTAERPKKVRAKSQPVAQPAAEPAPAPAPVSAPVSEPTVEAARVDPGTVFALGALCLVGPAMVATLFPFGRVIGLALAAVGLAVGLFGLVGVGVARRAGALAVALHSGALVVLLFLPSWLGLDPWRGPERPEGAQGPVTIENGSGAPKPLAPGDWLEAGKSSWQFRDARVALRRAGVGPVEVRAPNGTKRTTKENYLQLVVQVKNVGLEGEIPVPVWSDVVVTDANDQPLAPAKLEEGPAAPMRSGERVVAGHSAEVSFVFAAPPPKSAWVQLRLPATSFGGTDDIRFRVAPTVLPSKGPGK